MPASFGRVHPLTRTLLFATGVVTAVVLALALPLVTLAKATSYVILIVFALVNLALVFLEHRDPQPQGVRVYPFWVPLAGFAASAGMVIFQTVSVLRG